ncbi:MAG TPA: TonB family protein [Mucilaginibacter sp.]|nr:TonB family protein [Mucilaginibacter sp.]
MTWWQYLLLVNLYLVLFYGFYALLLRAETFFNLNRAYLVVSSLLSFFIPLIHYNWVSKLFITQQVQQTISVYARPITIYQFRPIAQEHHITIGNVIVFIYAAGALFLAARLIGQLISLKRIFSAPESLGAFSFFKSVRLGANMDNKDVIEAHELVHVSHWHSADVMLIEFIAIINWFNPVVYFYKFGIKHIHEFIADRHALKNGMTKAEYALLLLSQTLKAPANQLVTPFFNHSLLKKRIQMLQKSRSKYMALLKYGLSAPLFMLMLILSSAAVIKSHTVTVFNNKAEEVLQASAASLSPATITSSKEDNNSIATTEKDEANRAYLETKSLKAGKLHTEPVFVSVEQQPQFKGGMLAFYQFLALNLQYPKQMMRYNIQGKVIVALTVEKDGSLTDIKSIKDVGYGSAEEAIKVLKTSPKWLPGYQNGAPVRVRYTLPINFTLVKEKNSSDTVSKVTFTMNPEPDGQNDVREASPDSSRKFNLIAADDFDFRSHALYLLDGKVINDLSTVDANTIKSVKVIRHPEKDNVYVVLYGPKALNGVVVAESKKPFLKVSSEH